MVGIVVVSHSRPLAEAAVELARAMVPDARPRIAVAAGSADGGFGTDAAAVARAVAEVSGPDGVLVLTDLGSALLSTELALELDPPACEVRMSAAPFVEGLLGAVVRAVGGGTLDEVDAEAAAVLAAKAEHLAERLTEHVGEHVGVRRAPSDEQLPGVDAGVVAETGEVAETMVLVNPLGVHARPAAQIAVAVGGLRASVTIGAHGRVAEATSPSGLISLGAVKTDTIEVRASGPDAGAAVAAVRRLVEDGFGERDEAPSEALGLSPGRAVGPVIHYSAVVAEPPITVLDLAERPAEVARVSPAAAAVAAELRGRADAAVGEVAQILRATAVLAADPAATRQASAAVTDDGTPADRAVWDAFSGLADRLAGLDERTAQRAVDVRDVRDRVVTHLQGGSIATVPHRSDPFVLVAHDLAPTDTAALAGTGCVAIVTEQGGPTSHMAIVARAIGLPAVVLPGAAALPDGTTVEVDGAAGHVLEVSRPVPPTP